MSAKVTSLYALHSEGYTDFILIDSTDELVSNLRDKYPELNIWRRDMDTGDMFDMSIPGRLYIFPNEDAKYEKYLSEPNACIIHRKGDNSGVHSV